MDDLNSQTEALASAQALPLPLKQKAVPEDAQLPVASQGMASDLDTLTSGSMGQELKGISAGFPDMIKRAKAARADQVSAQQKAADEGDATTGSFLKQEGALEKPKPVDPATGKPKPPENDILNNFGSFASMMGIFASAFTKKPALNALNAAATAMNAKRQGDKEAYDEAYKAWQDNVETMFKQHQLEAEDYKQALDVLKDNYGLGMAMIKTHAAVWDSKAAATVADLGDVKEAFNLYETLQKSAAELKKNQIELDKFFADNAEKMRKTQVYDDTLEATFPQSAKDQYAMQIGDIKAKYAQAGKTGSPEEAKEIQTVQQAMQQQKAKAEKEANMAAMGKNDNSEGALLTDDDATFMADRFLAGDKSAVTGLGYGNVGAQNRVRLQHIIRMEAEKNNLSPQQVAIKLQEFQAMTRALGSVETKGGTIAMFAYEANKMADQALNASGRVKRGDFVPFNELEQYTQAKLSDPNLKQLKVALMGLKNTWAKAINGGGQPRMGDKSDFDEAIYQADGPKALKAGIEQIKKEILAAEQSPQQAIKSMRQIEEGDVEDPDSGEEKHDDENVPDPPEGFEVQ